MILLFNILFALLIAFGIPYAVMIFMRSRKGERKIENSETKQLYEPLGGMKRKDALIN